MTTSPPGTRAAAPAAAPAASSDDAADNAPPASPCLPIPLLGRFAASPFAECLVNYIDEEGRHPDWGLQNVLGLRTVHFETCGRYALASDAPAAAPSAHSHHPAELRLARRLAAEWGALLSGVDVWQGDESDHALRPYFAAAAAAATAGAAPRVVTEALVRDVAFGGALDPRYRLVIKPIPLPPTAGGGAAAATAAAVTASPHDGAVNPSPPPAHTEEALDAGFMVFRQRTLNMSDHFVETEHSWRDGDGARQLRQWRAAYGWLVSNPDLVYGSACLVSMTEPSHETCRVAREQGEQRPMGCVYPRIFAALTPGGSLVGVAAVVVHT